MNHMYMETTGAMFFIFTLFAAWWVLESMNRKYALKRMTRHHILWHTLPAYLLVPSSLFLFFEYSRHAASESIGFLSHGTPIELTPAHDFALIVWGIGISGWILHLCMESSSIFDGHLFKNKEDG